MNMNRKMIWMAAFVLLFLTFSCQNGKRPEPVLHRVVLAKPVSSGKTVTRNYSAIVHEAQELSLGFKVAGQISRVYVQVGDYVRKGQLLARIDDHDYQLGVDALQIQYDQLKDEVARSRKLFQQKSLSANDFEKAEAGLRQLQVQLQANKNKLAYTCLYAPVDGYVQAVGFSASEMVDAGMAVVTLMDVSRMEVVADVPYDVYQNRESIIGYSCRTTVAGREVCWPMKFLSLLPRADGNQLYQLHLGFREKPDERVTPGMNIEVGIETLTDTTAIQKLSVPLCSVFQEEGKTCVWVLNADSTVSRRQVTLGAQISDDWLTVVDGLTGQEQIVRSGVHALQEGERVKVIEAPAATNVGGLL